VRRGTLHVDGGGEDAIKYLEEIFKDEAASENTCSAAFMFFTSKYEINVK